MFDFLKKKETQEQRKADPSWAAVALSMGKGGWIAPRKAEGLSTVTACVNAISSAIASLPATVYRTRGGVKTEAPDHALAKLIANGVTENASWHDLVESMVADALLYGNALCEIRTATNGSLDGLYYIPWQWVTPVYLGNGRLAFDVSYSYNVGNVPVGERKRLLSGDVLHLKDRPDDGLLGRSRLERCAPVIRAAESLFEFTANLYKTGMFPSGAIEYSGQMTDGTRALLRQQLDAMYQGQANAGKALILSDGLSWKPLQMNAEQSELLTSRRFATEEICRCFGVPPQVVGDLSDSSYNVASEMFAAYRQQALLPWVNKLQSLFNRGLLGRAYSLELDLSTIEKADVKRRWDTYKIAVDAGILTVDEIRDLEGYNPQHLPTDG